MNLNEEPESDVQDFISKRDVGLMNSNKNIRKPILSNRMRAEITKLGSKYFQNSHGPFLLKNNCAMSSNWLKRKLANGEEVTRSWLMYLPSKKAAYSIYCQLYCRSNHQSSLQQEAGFSQRKAPERMIVHKNAKHHRKCFETWKELERNLTNKTGIIDAEFHVQIDKEKQKWCEILKRILHGIKYLAEQNLALQGERESLQADSDSNVGNFLGLIPELSPFHN